MTWDVPGNDRAPHSALLWETKSGIQEEKARLFAQALHCALNGAIRQNPSTITNLFSGKRSFSPSTSIVKRAPVLDFARKLASRKTGGMPKCQKQEPMGNEWRHI